MMERALNGSQVFARLVNLFCEPEGMLLGRAEAARRVGAHRTTIRRHWAAAMAEAERKLQEPVGPAEIAEIERALLVKAKEGGVMAARLLLMRRNLLGAPAVPDDGVKLVSEIKQLVEQHDHDDTNEASEDKQA